VVSGGVVGSRWARRFRIFRYELRRWRDGVIPDVAEAVESPQRLTNDPGLAQRVLDLVPSVPTLVWGRDELRAGEMWNSNSVISWLIARGGLEVDAVHPPAGGRAPGWRAGVVVARREETAPTLGREASTALRLGRRQYVVRRRLVERCSLIAGAGHLKGSIAKPIRPTACLEGIACGHRNESQPDAALRPPRRGDVCADVHRICAR
jgi:hypothetical protein